LPHALKNLVKDEEGQGNNFHIDFADKAESLRCQ
jgi:hypothetical protein